MQNSVAISKLIHSVHRLTLSRKLKEIYENISKTSSHTVVMEGKDNKSARELAWQLFEETGNFSYYMLYKNLKD